MSVAVAKANLADALKKLRQRWDRAREHWDDETARQFQRDYIDPLESRVVAAAKALEHVSEMMATVRRECGDD
ncbi:MAG: hypothetical protein WD749_05200 [Phycisphaerales bacterium]